MKIPRPIKERYRYGSLQITREQNGHLAAHLAFIRQGTSVVCLGYKQSSNTFGFGRPGDGGVFDPGWLAIDTVDNNVGIGTTSPDPNYKLDVNGGVKVNGDIYVTGVYHRRVAEVSIPDEITINKPSSQLALIMAPPNQALSTSIWLPYGDSVSVTVDFKILKANINSKPCGYYFQVYVHAKPASGTFTFGTTILEYKGSELNKQWPNFTETVTFSLPDGDITIEVLWELVPDDPSLILGFGCSGAHMLVWV